MTQEATTSRWIIASLVALWLHAVLLVLVAWLQPFSPGEVSARERVPIELTFIPPDARDNPERQATSNYFTELPEDRADLPPEPEQDPDADSEPPQEPEDAERESATFLSNVDSRARDRIEGGEANTLPRLAGEAESPQVGMRPQPAAQSSPEEEPVAPTDPREGSDERAAPAPDGPGRVVSRAGDPMEELRRPARPPESDPIRVMTRVGSQDIYQQEMSNPGGNALYFGDVSLNTLAWEYAPWMQRFKRRFMRNWIAPYAFHLGLIEGQDVVALELSPEGRILKLELLSSTGHESLSQATMAAFQALAPMEPLPRGFPEETLQLRFRVTYHGPTRQR